MEAFVMALILFALLALFYCVYRAEKPPGKRDLGWFAFKEDRDRA